MNVHSVKPAPFLFFHFPHFPRLDGDLDQTDSLLADWLDPNHLIASVTIIRPSVLLANNSEQDAIDPPYPITTFNAAPKDIRQRPFRWDVARATYFDGFFFAAFVLSSRALSARDLIQLRASEV